ncbi:extra-large G-protein 1 [Actinidia rufa]|uniref:Extra-large G-protein 1 n=1 Tax=Actinidia rufa TaxID=165716 RepID=A0A7J0F6S3_9ERIC|nr:extra-large G-protein 1 [Actinidia rufa]
MPEEGATLAGDGVEYSFAMEYHGPPITHDLPRAVVQPILAPDFALKELKLGSDFIVSPSSPIAFEWQIVEVNDSKELGLGSETTVSPTSVIVFEERAPNNGDFALSGELCSLSTSDFPNGDTGSGEFSDTIHCSTGLLSSSIYNEHSDELLGRVGSSVILNLTLSYQKENLRLRRGREHAIDALKETGSRKRRSALFVMQSTVVIVCAQSNGFNARRKKVCVTCIGSPIEETKRGNLGKCSRMLKRLLNDLEVQQIMKAEKFCEINQLPPEHVIVNGKALYQEELAILQSCPNPPKKLKPGQYWYDKVSGLWGKEGQKPSRIISPHLNVGGPIMVDASNGNTQVYINGREITKVELRMLQLAGVQCAGNPHFWVNEDGSYQEEGQKNTRGYIWGKAGTKLVCAILSLPVPSKSANPCGEQVSNVVSRTVPDYLEQRTLQKLLLIGYNGSGTSTIFKQAKILYNDAPFSEDERENIKLVIQTNVYGYLGILLEGRERFEDEGLNEMRKNQSFNDSGPSGNTDGNDGKTIYSVCPRLKAFSDWLLKIMVSGNLEAIFPAATREYAPLIEELWNNAAIQATYDRRSELELLPIVASYFLERVADILRPDYEPSDVDILYAEGVTSSNGLSFLDFSFPKPEPDFDIDTADQHDSQIRYQLIRVQARRFGGNCKWLEMFEDVRLVIFCVALSDYDQYAVNGDGAFVNKMLLSKKFFENIVTHPTFDQMDFLLILNKFDLFEEKIERVPLTQCDWFNDFCPVISRQRSNSNINNINSNPSLGQLAFHYIAVKFKRLYSSLTDRKLYVALVKGLEPVTVDEALKYSREILKWDEERPTFGLSEYSTYSTDASSFSH